MPIAFQPGHAEIRAKLYYKPGLGGVARGDFERLRTPIGDADLRIGAIALSRGLTVVTGNVRHFQRLPGLPLENWLKE